MKCIVKGCKNTDEKGSGYFLLLYTHEGFVPAWICSPCFQAMQGSKEGRLSQVVSNVENRVLKKGWSVTLKTGF